MSQPEPCQAEVVAALAQFVGIIVESPFLFAPGRYSAPVAYSRQ